MRLGPDRKTFVLAWVVLAALAAEAPPASAGGAAWGSHHRKAVNKHRAITSYRALQREYYIHKKGLYRGDPYANAWPYGQALAATISVASLPSKRARYRKDVRARLRGLEAYADRRDPQPAGYLSKVAPPRGPGGDRYNDDNEWFGIELVRAHHVHGMPTLNKARDVFRMVSSHWDLRPHVLCPGGIPQAPRVNGDRNTVSNAPAAELGTQLYLRTHNPAYLLEAKRMYDWVRGCMLTPDGLYWDHINRHGRIDHTRWTYNQGTMIGAGVMLYQATHDRSYLEHARLTAQAALSAFGPRQLDRQPDYFDAIYIRNLLLLGSATGNRRYRHFAERFAAKEWNQDRDRRNGLFRGHRGGEQMLDQAAMVQVYAMLVARPRTYF